MKFYLTTPLYYVNDVPHIGHAYTQIAADVLARYYRREGYDVFFLTGTDEHGQKIETAANAAGLTPGEFTAEQVKKFKDIWEKMNISFDGFIRTTESRHIKIVQEVFARLLEKDDIYLGTYQGWYCTPCETFFMDSQLIEQRCPDCSRKVDKVEEESYFFRLSKYQAPLLEHISANKEFILPYYRRNEVVSFINAGLKDISVSRTSFSWGVPLPPPFKNKHISYVWIDALLNYISAPGYIYEEDIFKRYWPADLHLIGKDILKFHAVIWPAILLSLELPLPKKIFAHGWWTVEGDKMSKSKGNVINPMDIINRFGLDCFRYFVLREVAFGQDGDFSIDAFIRRYNSDLANDLGNLVQRTVAMIQKYCNGEVSYTGTVLEQGDIELHSMVERLPDKIKKAYENIDFYSVLTYIWDVISFSNRYIENTAPWRLVKEDRKRLETVLYNLIETIRHIAYHVYPFMPDISNNISKRLEVIEQENSDRPVMGKGSRKITVKSSPPLFPRIEG